MSQLDDLCTTLTAIDGDVEAMARTLHQRAQDCRRVAQHAAATAHGAEPGSGQAAARAATALDAAARALAQAAALLAQAAQQGRQFVARTVGGGTGRGESGGPGAAASGSAGDPARPTLADLASVRDYTGTGYRDLNAALRGERPLTDEIAQRAEHLSAALSRLPDHTGPVFRGTTLDPAQLARYEPGSVVREPAFTSTSQAQGAAFAGDVLFVITSRHGKSVQHLSSLPHEAEVLFDKGARFYVARHLHDPQTGKRMINLIEV